VGQGFATCAGASLACGHGGGDERRRRRRRLAVVNESPRELFGRMKASASTEQAQPASHTSWAVQIAEFRSSDWTDTADTMVSCLSSAQSGPQTSIDTQDSLPSCHTLKSTASFSSWVNSLKAERERRLRTEAEVQNFLRAHGFSDANQLRQSARWGASPARRPLHVAVSLGDKAMVKLLLLHGADPALPDATGHLPSHKASKSARCSWEDWEEARQAAKVAAARTLQQHDGRRPSSVDRLFDLLRQDPLLDAPRRAREGGGLGLHERPGLAREGGRTRRAVDAVLSWRPRRASARLPNRPVIHPI